MVALAGLQAADDDDDDDERAWQVEVAAGELAPALPYDPDFRKALELTFREALRLGHNYIGTEHILLALRELEDGDGALADLGIDKPSIEVDIAAALDGPAR